MMIEEIMTIEEVMMIKVIKTFQRMAEVRMEVKIIIKRILGARVTVNMLLKYKGA